MFNVFYLLVTVEWVKVGSTTIEINWLSTQLHKTGQVNIHSYMCNADYAPDWLTILLDFYKANNWYCSLLPQYLWVRQVFLHLFGWSINPWYFSFTHNNSNFIYSPEICWSSEVILYGIA